ncbi:hypothetical protein DFH28DRAFT_1097279 [Melampsora americana]|nr:hypothetical protein DFH28DRAFT_1097279 [Melampsora americana]
MPNNRDEFFDDDDDDGFFNDEAILAQLDEVETQFTNTQKVSQPSVPPTKRPKLNHPVVSQTWAGVLPGEPRIGKPSSVSVQSNRPTSNDAQNYALQTRQQQSKSGPTKYPREPAVINRNLSLGMQALRTGTATSVPHPSRPTESSRPGVRSHVPPGRLAEMSLQRAAVLPTGHKPQPPSQLMNLENTNPRSIQVPQRDQVMEGFDAAAPPAGHPSRPLFRADQELERLQQQMESMNQALKEANLEKTRLRGEVSIVRSSLANHQANSLQQIQILRQNEQKMKAKAEAAEKELERLQREKETNQIFKGLEANARKPPTSVARKYQVNSTQLTQTQNLPPPGTSNVRPAPSKKEKAPAFRGFKDAFDVSHAPVADSQLPQSPSQRINPNASQGLVDPFVDRSSRRYSSQDTQIPQVPQVIQSQTINMAEIERNACSKPAEISHRIIANLLHNFIVDVNPNVPSNELNLMVGLQFILQCEFEDQSIQSDYNRVTRELFNSLGKSMSTDRSNAKEENPDSTNLVIGIGGSMFELTEMFYNARLVSSSTSS